MKKNLILLVLALLVSCKSPPELERLPEDGDKAKVSAIQLENGDWKFDFSELAVDGYETISVEASYYDEDNILVKIIVNKTHWKAIWATDPADPYGNNKETNDLPIPKGHNPLMPIIPASTGFVFYDSNRTGAYVIFDGHPEYSDFGWNGDIINGNGELTLHKD